MSKQTTVAIFGAAGSIGTRFSNVLKDEAAYGGPTWRRMRGVGIACLWEQGEVTDEAKEKVLRFLDLVSEEVDNHPVLAAEITLLLTHRFNIQLLESHKEIVEEARNQGLDSLELELLQRQIAPRQEEKNLNVEQFDLTTEESFALGTEGENPAAELPEDWNASDELLSLLRASMGTSSSSSASSRAPVPKIHLQAKPGSKVFIPPPLR